MTSPWASSKGEARAGDLLGLRALDGDGVAVNARGELVRVLEVSTKNPATLSVEQTVQVAEGFGALVNTLVDHPANALSWRDAIADPEHPVEIFGEDGGGRWAWSSRSS